MDLLTGANTTKTSLISMDDEGSRAYSLHDFLPVQAYLIYMAVKWVRNRSRAAVTSSGRVKK